MNGRRKRRARISEASRLVQEGLALVDQRTRELDGIVRRAESRVLDVTAAAERRAQEITANMEHEQTRMEQRLDQLRGAQASIEQQLDQLRRERIAAPTDLAVRSRVVPIWRTFRALLVLAGMALTLGGCQVIGSQAAPQAQLFAQAATNPDALKLAAAAASAVNAGTAVPQTYTVQRGTISDSVTIPGKVAPARAADLSFPVGGTLTPVYVHSGQPMHEGDPLAELHLSSEDLQAAQRQATLAQLTYENQQAKVDLIKAGALPNVIADAQAAVVRAQAALRVAILQRDQARGQPAQAYEVAQAQLALDQANADVAAATQAHNDAEAAAARQQQQQQQTRDVDRQKQHTDAQERLAAAAAAVRSAQRRVTDASSKLDQVVAGQAHSKAALEKGVQLAELAVQDATTQVQAAQAATQQSRAQAADPHHAAGAAEAVGVADAGVREAQIRVQTESTHLEQARAALAAAFDNDAFDQARQAVDQAQDDLNQAQSAQAGAQQQLDALNHAPQSAANADAAAQSDPASDPAVRSAQARADSLSLKLDQAQAGHAKAAQQVDTQSQIADLDVQAKQADLAAAQSRLNDLQNPSGSGAIDREVRLAELLRGEADDARAAAQPVFVLRAPFDGLVTGVSVRAGQAVQPRTTIIRYADGQSLSVMATASETEVSQLSAEESVTVTFPALQDRSVQGTVVDISDVGNVDDATRQTSYPVRVELRAAQDGLKMGMSALISLSLREARDVTYIPSAALRQANGKALVSRVEADGHISDVQVQVGATYGSNVEVTSGLETGDTVAVFSTSTVARSPRP